MNELMLLTALVLAAATTASAGTNGAEFNARVAEAIERSFQYKVVHDDILGEGPGFWDADPRYPTGTVNCIIWLQQLLAEAYGRDPREKMQAMDGIRYFGGIPGFSLRKHYTDHWLLNEPEPLVRVAVAGCGPTRSRHVRLEPRKFLSSRAYSCPLYRMSRSSFELSYLTRADLIGCQRRLKPGHYVLFAVPSEVYALKYLQESGAMGLVHAIMLKADGAAGTVYHASTAAKAVLKEPLAAYVERMKHLHDGYVLYEPDPAWAFRRTQSPDAEMLRVMECEAKLPPNSSH